MAASAGPQSKTSRCSVRAKFYLNRLVRIITERTFVGSR
jgi:hypothetical protein